MKKISIMILLLVVAMASCKKTPEVNLKYVDVERDLITVGTTTATVQCDYQYIATLKKAYYYYGEGEDEADMNTAEMRVVQNTLYVDLAGLRENTTYSYYYEFHNGFNSMRTVAKTFKTEGSGVTITLPTVITAAVTEITINSAKGGGEVTNDGGAEVTERGICWSTNTNPTLNDNHVTAGTGTGAFTAMMNGLEANTTYHVRAYATNEAGTAFGLDREFVTDGGGSGAPEGAINGLFTINANGDQVYFSQGNLQYQASTNTWRFAEHQWDYVGGTIGGVEYGCVYENGIKCNNALISQTYSGWIDLFGWGTSGYHDINDTCNLYYFPYSTNESNDNGTNNPSGYGPSVNASNPNIAGSNYDWGRYNAISNGGNVANMWRVMTKEEWEYIFYARNNTSGINYAKAQVNGINGVVLLPDNWDSSSYLLNNVNQSEASYNNNVISLSVWNQQFETHGVVFLPAAGARYGTTIADFGVEDTSNNGGYYWTGSFISHDSYKSSAWDLAFKEHNAGAPAGILYFIGGQRCVGHSVRLIQDAQ